MSIARIFSLPATMVLLLLLPPVALAGDSSTRDFKGDVKRITSRYILVDNGFGDRLEFAYLEGTTTVEGETTEWGEIRRQQRVTVSSKMFDKPRVAYRVVVHPAAPSD